MHDVMTGWSDNTSDNARKVCRMLGMKLYARPFGSETGFLLQYDSILATMEGSVGCGLDMIQPVDSSIALRHVFDPALSVVSYVPIQ